MTEMSSLYWETAAAKVAGFALTARRGGTLVRIDLLVAGPWELGDIVRQLAELRATPPAKALNDA